MQKYEVIPQLTSVPCCIQHGTAVLIRELPPISSNCIIRYMGNTGFTKTEHPYIVTKKTTHGIVPYIKGTGISARIIVGYYKMGMTAEEIMETLPHLNPAQVYDAISYYFDHRNDIEKEFKNNTIQSVLSSYDLEMDEDNTINRKS